MYTDGRPAVWESSSLLRAARVSNGVRLLVSYLRVSLSRRWLIRTGCGEQLEAFLRAQLLAQHTPPGLWRRPAFLCRLGHFTRDASKEPDIEELGHVVPREEGKSPSSSKDVRACL